MREILFRGKRADNGKWIYGFYELCSDMINSPFESVWSAIKEFGAEESTEVIPESVGQFTGLYDKNKVRIFEGDIIKCWPKNTKYEDCNKFKYGIIEYGTFNCGCCYGVYGFFADGEGDIINLSDDTNEESYAIVVGNKFDNPELLKVET